jgi:hypothetical protein
MMKRVDIKKRRGKEDFDSEELALFEQNLPEAS